MKRLMMTAVALALLTNAAAANLSTIDREMSPEERAAGIGLVAVVLTVMYSTLYVYDKHCEPLPQKDVDDYNLVLSGWDPVITADSMKGMEEEYRKAGKETFCKAAKETVEKMHEQRRMYEQQSQ